MEGWIPVVLEPPVAAVEEGWHRVCRMRAGMARSITGTASSSGEQGRGRRGLSTDGEDAEVESQAVPPAARAPTPDLSQRPQPRPFVLLDPPWQ